MDTEIMAYTSSDFWSPHGEGSSDTTNLHYPTTMDFSQDDVIDEVPNYQMAPSMTPDRSTRTDSTSMSGQYYPFSNQSHHANTYPSSFPWPNGYPYPGIDTSSIKLETSEPHLIEDGNSGIFLEPQSYDHRPDEPMPIVSSSANFHMNNGQHEPNTYHSATGPATWSTIPASWSAGVPESKNASHGPGWLLTSHSRMTSSAQVKLENDGKFKCNECEGDKTFSRPADLKRHMENIHSTITYSCGCCTEVQPKHIFKRKDKLLKHKRTVHGYPKENDGSSLMTCIHEDCVNGPDTVFFCTAEKLQIHMRQAHRHLGGIETALLSRIPPIQDPNTTASHSGVFANNHIYGCDNTTAKRHHSEEPVDASKRPKVLQDASEMMERMPSGGRPSNLRIHAVAYVSPDNITNGIDSPHINEFDTLERLKSTSLSSDLLLISQLSSGCESGSVVTEDFIRQLKELNIEFNIAERSIKVRGSEHDTTSIGDSELGMLLHRHYSSERRHAYHFTPLKHPVCLRNRGHERAIPDRAPADQIFAMRKTSDDMLIDTWHNDILPSLPRILATAIGGNYTATLVRKGEMESTSHAVIQIQCPTIPSSNLKEHIRSRILKHSTRKTPAFSPKIEFLSGSLVLLSGGTSPDQDEEEGRDYPYFKRFWKHPGMGAPIGLDCTEQVSATLGCYVHVDRRLYILTVKHFIPRSHNRLMRGQTETLTVASLPPSEVKETREQMQQWFRELDHEIRQTWIRVTGREVVDLEQILSPPKDVRDLLQKLKAVKYDLITLERRPSDFALGAVEYQSDSPTEAAPPLGIQIYDNKHHMDWALCRVDQNREGLNRHRYQYDEVTKQMDFVSGDVDMFGAGKICVETGTVEPGSNVHFVGQSSGLRHGIINPARSQVSLNGVSSQEWTMVVGASQQTNPTDFHGDSGAAVLQDTGNKLIGHLWGCANNSLVIAPITATFDDIRRKLNAQEVCLPPAHHASNEVELMCRDKSTEAPKVLRKIITSKMQTPKSTPNMTIMPLKLPAESNPVRELGDSAKSSPEDKLSLNYILAPPQPEKRNTFPMSKHSKWERSKIERDGFSWLALNVKVDSKFMQVLRDHPNLDFQNKFSLQYMLTPPRSERFARKTKTFPSLSRQVKLEQLKLKRSGASWSNHAPEKQALSAISVS